MLKISNDTLTFFGLVPMSIKPLFQHTLFRGAGEGQTRNGSGAGPLSGLCALIHGRAGCEDIVDQQYPLFTDLGGPGQTEGAFHVLRAFMAREFTCGLVLRSRRRLS